MRRNQGIPLEVIHKKVEPDPADSQQSRQARAQRDSVEARGLVDQKRNYLPVKVDGAEDQDPCNDRGYANL